MQYPNLSISTVEQLNVALLAFLNAGSSGPDIKCIGGFQMLDLKGRSTPRGGVSNSFFSLVLSMITTNLCTTMGFFQNLVPGAQT